jgi:hypothetical protein
MLLLTLNLNSMACRATSALCGHASFRIMRENASAMMTLAQR